MKRELGGTLDPALSSWVESANTRTTDFPIQNLPFGAFLRKGGSQAEAGVAIGDQILSLRSCANGGLLDFARELVEDFAQRGDLLPLLIYDRELTVALRSVVSGILRADNTAAARRAGELLVAQDDVDMLNPTRIHNYTDFYSSIHHATNVGSMFRPDNPLLPNYKHVPIGYHGRASSVGPSGSPVVRPSGQTKDESSPMPIFGPTKRLDYEMEVGALIRGRNRLGSPVPIDEASGRIFGLCLVNDWSARDIQSWEYQPLGPFLSKSFATTISPWIVTMEALAPFRVPAPGRPKGDPAPLPYLTDAAEAAHGAFDISLEVWLRTAAMRDQRMPPFLVSTGRFRDMYWTFGQMIAHHTSNGCNLIEGDLIASGTVSGPDEDSRGCLLERTWRGTKPLDLPSGEGRAFLEDGDEVIMRGYCEREGYRRIGFGACAGVITSG